MAIHSYYVLVVLFCVVPRKAECDDVENDHCIKPNNPLRIKRETKVEQDYTCSDDFVDFTCTKEGRFPDLGDTSCTWYFECIKNSRGFFIHKYVQCPSSKFSPVLQKCTSEYKCPCDIATQPPSTLEPDWWCSDLTIPDFKCDKVGRFPDLRDNNCKQYFLCSKFHNDTWVKTSYTCQNSVFNPVNQKCNAGYTCPCVVPTTPLPTTTTTIATTTSKPTLGYICKPDVLNYVGRFHCEEIGRYPDLGDANCQKYFLCSKLRNETWVKTRYACSGSTFDPSLKKCSIHYPCPCDELTTTVPPATDKPATSMTTPVQCSYNVQDHECTAVGRFPDVSDFECQRYFLCSQYKNGTWVKKSYKCLGSNFDPVIQRCNVTYVCPCATTTVSVPTTCTPPSEPLPDFRCQAVGRFPDLADPNCKKYYLCSLLHNGTWIRTRYSCKDSSFAPEIEKCHISYPCPCLTYYTTPFSQW